MPGHFRSKWRNKDLFSVMVGGHVQTESHFRVYNRLTKGEVKDLAKMQIDKLITIKIDLPPEKLKVLLLTKMPLKTINLSEGTINNCLIDGRRK